MEPRTDEQRFRDMATKLGEHFEEYVVIVRPPEGSGIWWTGSENTWALGAVTRVAKQIGMIDHSDFNSRSTGA